MVRNIFTILVVFCAWAYASVGMVPLRDTQFDRSNLIRPSGFQLLDPSRFGMQQSYSVSYASSSLGSHSTGVYLNTLSYRFSIPLTLSMDVGLYNLFHSEFQGRSYTSDSQQPQFLIPRIGLEYQPTANTTISLQVINMPDAWQAYGMQGYSSPWRRWPAGDYN